MIHVLSNYHLIMGLVEFLDQRLFSLKGMKICGHSNIVNSLFRDSADFTRDNSIILLLKQITTLSYILAAIARS